MNIYDYDDVQKSLEDLEEENTQDAGQKNYYRYLELHGDRRLMNRVLNGRSVKPCNRECFDYAIKIAKTGKHTSFENFDELMDDEDFLINCALITPDPIKCENYFYKYVNVYLKNKPEFKLKFLKNVYLNENVYTLDSINWIVENFNMKKQNKQLLKDYELKQVVEAKIKLINALTRISENTRERLKNALYDLIETFTCVKPEVDLRDELGLVPDELSNMKW